MPFLVRSTQTYHSVLRIIYPTPVATNSNDVPYDAHP